METLPAEILEGAAPVVPVLRKGRPAWDREPPVAELAAARFPNLVVSGGHSEGFEAICDELAEQIGASRAVVEGAGHEIQFTGVPINGALRNLWAGAGQQRLKTRNGSLVSAYPQRSALQNRRSARPPSDGTAPRCRSCEPRAVAADGSRRR